MNRQLNEINMLRAIACVAVVLTHSITNYVRTYDPSLFDQDKFITYLRFALLWATPVFIMISELLIAKNYPDGVRKGFLLKRVKYILIPYILIGLIRSYMHSEGELSVFLTRAWETIVLGKWYGFFVIVIFQFYVLHILLGHLLKKSHPLPPILISFILSFGHLYVHAHHKEYRVLIEQVYPFWDRTFFIGWLFYFVVAFYIGQNYEKVMDFFTKHVYIPLIGAIASYLLMMNRVMDKTFSSVKSDRYDILVFALIGWAMLFYESRLTKPFTGRIKILEQPTR